jgi:hypothetical protein
MLGHFGFGLVGFVSQERVTPKIPNPKIHTPKIPTPKIPTYPKIPTTQNSYSQQLNPFEIFV